MNKTYDEIRAHCQLVDYLEVFSGHRSLWCETYRNATTEYKAYFDPFNPDIDPQLLQKVTLDQT